MATRTIADGGGNWNTVGTWVEGAVPTAADDVVATGTSGNLTINTPSADCRSFDMTGYVGTLTHNSTIPFNIGDGTTGHFKLVAGMVYAPPAARIINFISTTTGNQITTAGKSLSATSFNGAGGDWTFLDNPAFIGTFTVLEGTVDLTGRTLTSTNGGAATAFASTGVLTRAINLTNATVNLKGGMNFAGSNFTRTTTGSVLNFSGTGNTTFQPSATTWPTVNITAGNTVTLSSSAWTIDNLTISGVTGVSVATTTKTVTGTFTISGTVFVSSTPGTQRTFALGATGAVVASNVTFTDMVFTGTNTPVSGTGLVNGGNNSGITFPVTARRMALTGVG